MIVVLKGSLFFYELLSEIYVREDGVGWGDTEIQLCIMDLLLSKSERNAFKLEHFVSAEDAQK